MRLLLSIALAWATLVGAAAACGERLELASEETEAGPGIVVPPAPEASVPDVVGKPVDAMCVGALCDCDGDPANGRETDTASTAAHCGGCGRACGGCDEGVCVAQTLVSELVRPAGIVATEDSLLFASSPTATTGTISRFKLVNGRPPPGDFSPPTDLASGEKIPYHLVIDGAYLYWTEAYGREVKRSDLTCTAGCGDLLTAAGTPTPTATGYVSARGASAHWLFWNGAAAGLPNLFVLTPPATATSIWTGAAGASPSALFEDATGVFVAIGASPQGGIFAVETGGACEAGAVCQRKLASFGVADAEPGMVEDGDDIVFTRPSMNRLERVSKSGLTSSILVEGQRGLHLSPILVGRDLYWLAQDGVDGGLAHLTAMTMRLGEPTPPRAVLRVNSNQPPSFFAVTSSAIFIVSKDTAAQGRIVFGPR